MPTLEISNFLGINSGCIDIKPYTIVIGPQASGKSIIAKLAYFFSKVQGAAIIHAIQKKTIHDLRSSLMDSFYALFPRYTISDMSFKIKFTSSLGVIDIEGNSRYKIYFSNEIQKLFRQVKSIFNDKKSFSNFIDELKQDEGFTIIDDEIDESFYAFFQKVVNKKFNTALDLFSPHIDSRASSHDTSIYIPAARSLISILEKNVFSIYNKIVIDPVLDDFGRQYETIKNLYISRSKRNKDDIFQLALKLSKNIMKGSYDREGEKEYIVNKQKRNELVHTSSGQQSTLPLILSLLKPLLEPLNSNLNIYIEEPEAHIHPEAQYEIVKLMTTISEGSEGSHRLFITTHSPYILSSINNILLAGKKAYKNEYNSNIIYELLGTNQLIHQNKTSAYKIELGEIVSIFDNEDGIIEADNIDTVSETIYQDFCKIVELEND